MATRFDLRCPQCDYEVHNVIGGLGCIPNIECPQCEVHPVLQQTFRYRHDVAINFGYRESHYNNKTDSDIAKFQFEHL